MKFSVWDYSQVKIAQFNESHPNLAIDPTDIFIFTWFKGFANKTKSKRANFTKGMWTKNINGVEYFNVRYDAIIRDFPILKFSSVKSIQRRFDKYVEAGIFEKTIVHAGKNGNFTYFAFTDLFWSFEYDNENPEHKQVSVDNSVQTKQVSVDNSVQTKQVSADNSVQTKQVSADNSVQTLIYNPDINLNNPTTSSSSFRANAEEVFSKTIITLFGYNPYFNPNPYPILLNNFKYLNLKEIYLEKYLNWIFGKLKAKCKNPDNFASYFYKSFTQLVYIAKFAHDQNMELQKIANKQQRQITCPVCGTIHDENDSFCTNDTCHLPKDFLESQEDINREKSLYQLKKNDFEKYTEYQNQLKNLQEKYPISIRLINKEKKKEFDNLLSELESKFLNLKKTA